jgi:TolA-binding protein
MTSQEGELRVTEGLGPVVELARTSVQPATPTLLSEGWHSVSARLTARRVRRRMVVRWSVIGAIASACVVLAIGGILTSRSRLHFSKAPALAYQIEGGRVIDGGYLHESGTSGMKLFFDEGTEFILMPGARGRLRELDSLGAHIAIEQGSASFQVTPRAEARWLVDVGPFRVTVKGTVFAVSWDAATERFELRLRHGRVSVTGPVSGGEIALRAGQRLVVDLPKSETVITEQKPEEAWLEPIEERAASSAAEVPEGASSPASERPSMRSGAGASLGALSKSEENHRWAEAVAAGKWDRILAEVERVGVKVALEKASSEDLFAVADAARYRSRIDLARDALQAERRRFPNSMRALDAAFLLGRLEEGRERGASKALQWYDEYLARTPTGTYAAEALGRKMVLTNRIEGAARAEPIARDYLRRFPNGTYAGAARALRRGP